MIIWRSRIISSAWRSFKNLLGKTGTFIRNALKSASTKIPRDSAILAVSLILVFIIALLVRLAPVFVPYQALLKEFDPFYFLSNVNFIVKNGFAAWFTWKDNSVWYPFGRDVAGNTYPGMVFTAVLIYYFVNAIGIQASTFTVAYFMPVLFGGLTPIVVYFLGKEVYDKRSGLLAAFFIALSPAIIQRQVAGFFDNDPFGVFLMLTTFYFFIRSLKRSSIPSAIAAGLFLGYLCISWGTYVYAVDIFALFTFLMVLARRYSLRLFTSYTITMLIGLFIATLAPRNGLGLLVSGESLPALFMLGLLIAYESSKYVTKIPMISKTFERISKVNPFLLAAILLVGGFMTLLLTPIGGKFYTVVMPLLRNTQAMILASVGEHQPSDWASFFYYLGIVMILSVVGVYYSFKRLKDEDVFVILATITLVYFSGSMVRIVISLSPILALLAGYGLSNILKPFAKAISTTKEELVHRKRVRMTPAVGREYSAATFFIIGILLLGYGNTIISAPPHGSTPLIQQMSPPDIIPGNLTDWLQAMSWLNYQTPPGSVVVSWWDYGYYISYVGNRTSVCDNATSNSTQIAWVGLGFMETNETASLQIFKRFNAQYALVYFGNMQTGLAGDEGKWIWMARIASDSFAAQGLINKTKYFNETSQQTLPMFFNTTLYRLLFNGEPYELNGGLDDYCVLAMGTSVSHGISTQTFPAVHPDASVLDSLNTQFYSSYSSSGYENVPTIDSYGPMFFQPAFVSSNHLVKIYKIDYTPLAMMGNLAINATKTHVYSNGTAIINAVNIGGSGTPPIPFNYYTDSSGRQLQGTLWLNGTNQASFGTISIWNSTTSSWVSRSNTYSISPGQSVTFKVTGLDTELLQTAYNRSTSLPMRVLAAYDPNIYAAAQISVESS
jgi:dolichyl-diphosphooligosaccharide--protein glycosyltransferase